MSNIRYCIYARKSSEQDEKQAMSIESQFREMRKIQEAEDLDVVKIIEECKSAKTSFSRPGFTQLMAGLMDGEYEAILTWAVDRLSRNAGDLGMLVDLMDQEKLQVVRTHDRTFLGNNPNEKFLLMLLGSQAKLENENRGKNVQRGMRAACEQGRRPYATPLGYKLVPGEDIHEPNRAVIDEEKAPIVKEIFRLVGEENKSIYHIWKDMDRLGKFSKHGKKLAKSRLQKMLADTFYYGEFEYPKKSGNWYKGIHEPLITKELYDKVQTNIAKRGPREPRRKWGEIPFKFNRIFKCGECGSGISGEIYRNRYNRLYLYYSCNKYNSNCKQLSIRGKNLLAQIEKIAEQITDLDISELNQRQKDDMRRCNFFIKPPLKPYQFIQDELVYGSLQKKSESLQALNGRLLIKDKQVIYESKNQSSI